MERHGDEFREYGGVVVGDCNSEAYELGTLSMGVNLIELCGK